MSSVIKKVKIAFEYNGNIVNIEMGPYKTIKDLKEKAAKLFYLNYEVKLYGNNKDLTPYENWTIGEFFKNKPNIQVKVMQLQNYFFKEEKPLHQNLDLSISMHTSTKTSTYVICECLLENVSYYCRNCWVFICNSCRKNVS